MINAYWANVKYRQRKKGRFLSIQKPSLFLYPLIGLLRGVSNYQASTTGASGAFLPMEAMPFLQLFIVL